MSKKRILFVCTGNACRSPIAEGLLNHLASDRYDVISAGTNPARIHNLSVKTMLEWGIDISKHESRSIEYFVDKKIDIVITLCNNARIISYIFPEGTEYVHWDVPDPFPGWVDEVEYLPKFREVRNIIRNKIELLLDNKD